MAPKKRISTEPTRKAQARNHLLTTPLLLLCLAAQYATAAPPTIVKSADNLNNQESKKQTVDMQISAIHGIVPRDQQQTPGSSCPGSEGQWNCMTDSWQRCAAGKWSVVMQCAAGTACAPAGLTYDFKVQFSGGQAQGTASSGSSSLGGMRLQLVWPLMFMAAVICVVVQVFA